MKVIIDLFRRRTLGQERIYRTLRLAVSLTSALFIWNAVATAQSVQSIDVSPLVTGQNFTITVTGSPDVTSGTATFTFIGSPRQLEIPLAQQGSTFTGSGLVPANIRRQLP